MKRPASALEAAERPAGALEAAERPASSSGAGRPRRTPREKAKANLGLGFIQCFYIMFLGYPLILISNLKGQDVLFQALCRIVFGFFTCFHLVGHKEMLHREDPEGVPEQAQAQGVGSAAGTRASAVLLCASLGIVTLLILFCFFPTRL